MDNFSKEIDRLFIEAIFRAINETDYKCLPVEWQSNGISAKGISIIINYYGGRKLFITKKHNRQLRQLKGNLSNDDFKTLKSNYTGLSIYIPCGNEIINYYTRKLLKDKINTLLELGYSKVKISEYLCIPRSSLYELIK